MALACTQAKRHRIMNEYFLRSLIRQRHAQILAEVRATQPSQLARSRVTRANRSIRLFRSFITRLKKTMILQPTMADERRRV